MRKYLIPALCILNILIHLSSIFYMEFHRDELLYFSFINHLDWGYASVPPLISWLAALADTLFGFSPFAVKIFPALLSGALVYVSAQIAKELGGGIYAQVLAGVVIMCTPLGMRAFILFQPVPFDIFFWTLTFYILLKYINSNNNKWLYYLGVCLGIAVLNKYLILFLIFSALIILPFSPYKNLFKRKAFYGSLAIAIAIASPNIFWQFSNDFPVFTHMAELEANQLQNVTKSSFLFGQVFMLLGGIIISLIGLYHLISTKKLWYLGAVVITVFLLLMFMDAKDYYVAGIYPFLIATGSYVIEKTLKSTTVRAILLSAIVLLTIPFVPFGIPLLSPKQLANYFDKLEEIGLDMGRVHEDGEKHPLPQDYADMLGWYTIADLTHQAYLQAEDQEALAIFGENYGIAGAISLINDKYGMPECLSFSDSYEYWNPEQFDPDITSFIYVNTELGADVDSLFRTTKLIGQVTDPLSRQYGVQVYLCENPRRSFNAFWKETLDYVREN